jgi:hypothetical protein
MNTCVGLTVKTNPAKHILRQLPFYTQLLIPLPLHTHTHTQSHSYIFKHSVRLWYTLTVPHPIHTCSSAQAIPSSPPFRGEYLGWDHVGGGEGTAGGEEKGQCKHHYPSCCTALPIAMFVCCVVCCVLCVVCCVLCMMRFCVLCVVCFVWCVVVCGGVVWNVMTDWGLILDRL